MLRVLAPIWWEAHVLMVGLLQLQVATAQAQDAQEPATALAQAMPQHLAHSALLHDAQVASAPAQTWLRNPVLRAQQAQVAARAWG